MEVVSTFQKNLTFFLQKMEFKMINLALIHLIKMAQTRDIGEPLFEMGRCLLTQVQFSKEFWRFAVMAAAHIHNRCYNKSLKKLPYQAMAGWKPNLSNMRTFGSKCFAYKERRNKLDDKCTKEIFLGYDKSSPSYLVFISDTNNVMKYRVVKFPTMKVNEQKKNKM